MCGSHIYFFVFYRHSELPLYCTVLENLEKVLLHFVWGKWAPLVRCKICYRNPSESVLEVLTIKIRLHALCLTFLGRMYARYVEGGELKENPKKNFPTLEGIDWNDGETGQLPRNKCIFYREYQHVKVFSQLVLVYLTAGPYRVGHYIEYYWEGRSIWLNWRACRDKKRRLLTMAMEPPDEGLQLRQGIAHLADDSMCSWG